MEIVAVKVGTEIRMDSRLMASRFGNKHKNVLALIAEHQARFEEMGQLLFEAETVTNSVGAANQTKYAMLTEDQTIFLLTLARNSPATVQLKMKLVQAFSKARELLASHGPDFSALERLAGLTVQALTVVKAEIQQQVAVDIRTAKEEVRAEVADEMTERIGSLGATSEQRHEVKTLVRAVVVARTRMNLGNSSWPAVYTETWNACRVGSLDVMTRAQYPQVEAYLRAELVALGAMSDTGLFSEKHAGVA